MPQYIDTLGVEVSYDVREALEWCNVALMLRIQLERQETRFFPSLREYAMFYGVDRTLLDDIDNDITIMHPGPINRGVELTSDVADSKQSIILQQVENGVAIRMAVLYLLAGKREQA
jgi:aspartate carbamoyltransferase catalytic subunit